MLSAEELQIICCRILQHLASLAPVAVADAWPLLKAALEAHENAAVHQAAWHVWELVALQVKRTKILIKSTNN